MPSFLQIENISKSYGPKVLFEHIGFNVNDMISSLISLTGIISYNFHS